MSDLIEQALKQNNNKLENGKLGFCIIRTEYKYQKFRCAAKSLNGFIFFALGIEARRGNTPTFYQAGLCGARKPDPKGNAQKIKTKKI